APTWAPRGERSIGGAARGRVGAEGLAAGVGRGVCLTDLDDHRQEGGGLEALVGAVRAGDVLDPDPSQDADGGGVAPLAEDGNGRRHAHVGEEAQLVVAEILHEAADVAGDREGLALDRIVAVEGEGDPDGAEDVAGDERALDPGGARHLEGGEHGRDGEVAAQAVASAFGGLEVRLAAEGRGMDRDRADQALEVEGFAGVLVAALAGALNHALDPAGVAQEYDVAVGALRVAVDLDPEARLAIHALAERREAEGAVGGRDYPACLEQRAERDFLGI